MVFGSSVRPTSTSHAAAYHAFSGKLRAATAALLPRLPEGNIRTSWCMSSDPVRQTVFHQRHGDNGRLLLSGSCLLGPDAGTGHLGGGGELSQAGGPTAYVALTNWPFCST